MDFEQLENSIVTYLQGKLDPSLVEVRPLPDNLNEYEKPFATAFVNVMFTGEKVDDNQSTDEVSQHTTFTFNLSVQSRTLRGLSGVYSVSELVKSRLMGFWLPNSGRMYFVSQDFTNVDLDIWEHTLVFGARSLRVQEYMSDDYPDNLDNVFPSKVDLNHHDDQQTIYQS